MPISALPRQRNGTSPNVGAARPLNAKTPGFDEPGRPVTNLIVSPLVALANCAALLFGSVEPRAAICPPCTVAREPSFRDRHARSDGPICHPANPATEMGRAHV